MLKYHKIDLFLQPHELTPLPFIGSTLRGAFGMSLKDVTCINPTLNCEGCFAKDSCLYFDFFEKKNSAHSYRFDFELNPRFYDFTLYLFEDATKELSNVLEALELMLTKYGLTYKREKFKIAKVLCNDIDIYIDGKFDISDIKALEFKKSIDSQNIELEFKTPLRMKHKGKILKEEPSLDMLLYSIHNRLKEIKKEPREKLSFKPRYKELESSIKFSDQTRLSNRQKTKLQMGGIVGNIKYDDIDKNSLNYLNLAEIIGLGKQTVFGMGKILIKER